MKPAAQPRDLPPVRTPRSGDVLKHLADSLRTQSQRYRKRLKECQQHFSEDAVHKSRVETRRLLATVELLHAFIPDRDIEKSRVALKQHLDTFADLRDTQVQLVYVGRLIRAFPAARNFHEWLLKREARFARRACKNIKRVKTKRLARRIGKFERQLRRLQKHKTRGQAIGDVLAAMNRAFARVAQLERLPQLISEWNREKRFWPIGSGTSSPKRRQS